MSRYWVLVIGEAEGLHWVLKNSKMAFTEAMSKRAGGIQPGDGLILYVGRGAFHSPTKDESQLAGVATVRSNASRSRKAIPIAGREFTTVCGIDVEIALPERRGVPIKPLVSRLRVVKRPEVWGQYFRQGLIEITKKDFDLMRRSVIRASS
jgi:hypothetical protein